MRIALLSPLPPERNGIADYASHLREALEASGLEVSTPLAGHAPLATVADARAWVARQDWKRVDVVHAELGGGRVSEFLALSALAEMRQRTPTPGRPALSATAHDPERLVWRPVSRGWLALQRSARLPRLALQGLAVLGDPLTLRAERQLARRLDGLVALTRTGADRLAARMGTAEHRVGVIPHGVRQLAPLGTESLFAAVDRREPIRLLYFGFIYAGKGIEDLIDALAALCHREPAAAARMRLTIAGGTAPDIAFGAQGGYLDSLRERVASAGLTAQVEWVLDVAEPDIPALILGHHAMVLPYRESRKLALLGQMRGTSGALAWAIACGRGVITSDARAFAEEIASGNGLSYPQGDVAALSARLGQLLHQPAQLLAWASRAAELAEERAWPRTAERFGAYFRSLLRPRPADARAHTGLVEEPLEDRP